MNEICISKSLIERIKNYKPLKFGLEGDLYGLQDGEGSNFILTCCLNYHQLHHDPTLLFSPSFVRLGSLVFHEKEPTAPKEQGNDIKITCCGGSIKVFVLRKNDDPLEVQHKVFAEKDLARSFILARIPFYQEFSCRNKTADVKNAINEVAATVSSSEACFRMRGFNIIFQNKDKKILSLKEGFLDSDSPLGDLYDSPGKKQSFELGTFDFFWNKSMSAKTAAPIAQIDNNKVKVLCTNLKADAVIYISKKTPLADVSDILKKAFIHQIHLAEFWLVKQLNEEKLLSPLKSYVFNQPMTGHVMSVIYPEDAAEDLLKDYRRLVHDAFLLPLTVPLIRKGNLFAFPGEKVSRILINPHEGLTKADEENRDVAIVHGRYAYHHYMQDQFDDNKWGCAYRSLQTLISWFRLQGYTDKPIPKHKEIQQILVDIRDKPPSFVGSKQWIGSTEVGFVLETYLDVTSKFLSVSSGADLASKGRELSLHFKVEGTPIMIGGGVLAHTILGVDWSPITGDIKYLILDPHYTGGENLNQILKNGWCGWKGPNFWKANAFYNLCLPQKPICF